MGNCFSSDEDYDPNNTSSCFRSSTHLIIKNIVFPAPTYNVSTKTLIIDYGINFVGEVPFILHRMQGATKYIVFAHGNGSDIIKMNAYGKELSKILNINILLFEYPGYSVCSRSSSERGCYDNLEIIVNYLINDMKVSKNNIYLVGNSLGTGVVAHYAATHPWTTPIMLISPYKTIASVVVNDNNTYCRLLKDRVDMFETIKKLNKIKSPVKILHGDTDTVIDISHAKTLYDKVVNKMTPVWYSGIGHNEILWYISTTEWRDFLQE